LSVYPRVAFLPDTFHEVNGVALTSRQLEAFARRRQIPFLSIHPGPVNEVMADGPVVIRQLQRGPACIPLDANLPYDILMGRYANRVLEQVKEFGADLIHITGPGDMGSLGLYAAWRLRLPLVISWHTSLHEYAGRRLERVTPFLGRCLSRVLGRWAEQLSLSILRWFYRKAEVILAPNDELVAFLRRLTGRPVFLMRRGVETDRFSPLYRRRASGPFRIGYVGRLTPEKNVRFLAQLSRAITARGHHNFEFVIVGQGTEEQWLCENVVNSTVAGVLRGVPLAEAYADMDLFVFPSSTDTFGNVILEALASGVPAVVTSTGGPKFLVQHGVTGYVAADDEQFIDCVCGLVENRDLHARMREAARAYAVGMSWDSVFEKVFAAYSYCLNPTPQPAPMLPAAPVTA
jgi:phosphatidylinositol alpha 1,6-mannosyltransferase